MMSSFRWIMAATATGTPSRNPERTSPSWVLRAQTGPISNSRRYRAFRTDTDLPPAVFQEFLDRIDDPTFKPDKEVWFEYKHALGEFQLRQSVPLKSFLLRIVFFQCSRVFFNLC